MSYRRSEDQPNDEILGEAMRMSPGWADILENLDKMIQYIDPDYKIGQIKEKFGGLRYYINPTDNYTEYIRPRFDSQSDPISVFISWAENRSFRTCEDCGRTDWELGVGNVVTAPVTDDDFWILTLCTDCREEKAQERVN